MPRTIKFKGKSLVKKSNSMKNRLKGCNTLTGKFSSHSSRGLNMLKSNNIMHFNKTPSPCLQTDSGGLLYCTFIRVEGSSLLFNFQTSKNIIFNSKLPMKTFMNQGLLWVPVWIFRGRFCTRRLNLGTHNNQTAHTTQFTMKMDKGL